MLAMYELANCFRNGWGVAKDPVAARHYYETAANLGDTDAMNEAAWCFLEGFGGKKDRVSENRERKRAREIPICCTPFFYRNFHFYCPDVQYTKGIGKSQPSTSGLLRLNPSWIDATPTGSVPCIACSRGKRSFYQPALQVQLFTITHGSPLGSNASILPLPHFFPWLWAFKFPKLPAAIAIHSPSYPSHPPSPPSFPPCLDFDLVIPLAEYNGPMLIVFHSLFIVHRRKILPPRRRERQQDAWKYLVGYFSFFFVH